MARPARRACRAAPLDTIRAHNLSTVARHRRWAVASRIFLSAGGENKRDVPQKRRKNKCAFRPSLRWTAQHRSPPRFSPLAVRFDPHQRFQVFVKRMLCSYRFLATRAMSHQALMFAEHVQNRTTTVFAALFIGNNGTQPRANFPFHQNCNFVLCPGHATLNYCNLLNKKKHLKQKLLASNDYIFGQRSKPEL